MYVCRKNEAYEIIIERIAIVVGMDDDDTFRTFDFIVLNVTMTWADLLTFGYFFFKTDNLFWVGGNCAKANKPTSDKLWNGCFFLLIVLKQCKKTLVSFHIFFFLCCVFGSLLCFPFEIAHAFRFSSCQLFFFCAWRHFAQFRQTAMFRKKQNNKLSKYMT